TCCSHGACHILSVNVPVVVGGITVYPADLLHGDCNGVTTIPTEIANEIPDVCREFMQAEKIVLDYVRSQSPTPMGFTKARLAMSEAVQQLAARIRRP
ncbi:MAG TPA: RraA family protein, partial [Planctomycetes bacterium]|nr:RraA family protein [Planctomycetota bacterium]